MMIKPANFSISYRFRFLKRSAVLHSQRLATCLYVLRYDLLTAESGVPSAIPPLICGC